MEEVPETQREELGYVAPLPGLKDSRHCPCVEPFSNTTKY